MQHPWLLKLAGYDYIVEYKKGVENKVAHALSRRDELEEVKREVTSCKAISVVEHSWRSEVRQTVNQSQFFHELQEKADKGALHSPKYKKLNGISLKSAMSAQETKGN